MNQCSWKERQIHLNGTASYANQSGKMSVYFFRSLLSCTPISPHFLSQSTLWTIYKLKFPELPCLCPCSQMQLYHIIAFINWLNYVLKLDNLGVCPTASWKTVPELQSLNCKNCSNILVPWQFIPVCFCYLKQPFFLSSYYSSEINLSWSHSTFMFHFEVAFLGMDDES